MLLACTGMKAEVIAGSCGAEGDGSNVTYKYDTETNHLVISGTGKMEDFAAWGAVLPWNSVATCEINEGVTTVGNYAFSGCAGLTRPLNLLI